jgi:urate oxidase
MTVGVLLEGGIETSWVSQLCGNFAPTYKASRYTKADNSVVVATDTMKNTVHGELVLSLLVSTY